MSAADYLGEIAAVPTPSPPKPPARDARLVVKPLSTESHPAGTGIGGCRRASSPHRRLRLATASPPSGGSAALACNGRGVARRLGAGDKLRTLFLLGGRRRGYAQTAPGVACADMEQIFAIETVLDETGRERFFNVASRHLLEAAIIEHRIDWVVIDPLTTIMPGTDRNARATPATRSPRSSSSATGWNVTTGVAHIGKSEGARRSRQILGADRLPRPGVVGRSPRTRTGAWCSAWSSPTSPSTVAGVDPRRTDPLGGALRRRMWRTCSCQHPCVESPRRRRGVPARVPGRRVATVRRS